MRGTRSHRCHDEAQSRDPDRTRRCAAPPPGGRVAAATGGNVKFFLGTDSAPHAKATKENACGCAGCYTAPVALALYAEAFEAAGALRRLEGFASHFGADFYGLPRSGEKVTLTREPWTVPDEYRFGEARVVPLRAGALNGNPSRPMPSSARPDDRIQRDQRAARAGVGNRETSMRASMRTVLARHVPR